MGLSLLHKQNDHINLYSPQWLEKEYLQFRCLKCICISFDCHCKLKNKYSHKICLTHWGRVTHICVSKLTIIGSDNGLSPGRRQAIIWTNAGILLIRLLGTNFNEILVEILTLSFMKMRLKVSSAKWRPFCPGLNVLITPGEIIPGNSCLYGQALM